MSELSDAINEMRNMRESYDQIGAAAEAYNTGKTELAANINAKGIQASATETLPELAEKVGAIAQTQTILEGGEIYAAQQFGDGALWNLYQVLADMKTRFIGNGDYSALIVCEYYKGYDSLQLQGADAYYTCDGDLYEYASPNHVWHDEDNGKANRWVAFLYRDEGARLDITNTAISPCSMYIGGHIGTIEYFVNGRLTALVGGVEKTDVVDNFLSKEYMQPWDSNVIIRGVKQLYSGTYRIESANWGFICSSQGNVVLSLDNAMSFQDNQNKYGITANNCNIFVLNANKISCQSVGNVISCTSAVDIYLNVEEYQYTYGGVAVNISATTQRLFTALKKITLMQSGTYTTELIKGTSSNLILVSVGELENNLRIKYWNPTNVLADATKKAQLIDNIKNHILAKVKDVTGGTQLVFTVSTNMFNAIANETITWQGQTMTLADAFLTKNWLLAGA